MFDHTDYDFNPATTDERAARTQWALRSIERSRKRRAGEANGLLFAAVAFGEASQTGPIAKSVKVAQGICIIATGVIPVMLFWAFVYPG